jgi:hypothetical protein
MTFLHPILLAAGLASIAIPIIIHLLMNRRRKPVMWGAMRFLEEAFRRTRKRLLLEKWLLLAARCLLLALLALAIGRPLLGGLGALGGAGGTTRTFFIVIDNSIAAQATDDAGKTALSRHIEAAREVLATLRPLGGVGGAAGSGGDRIALITLAHPAEGLVLPASPDAGAISTLLDGLEPADAKADVAGAMSLIAAALSPDQDGRSRADTGAAYVVLLSDFLEGSADLGPGAGGAGGAGGAVAAGAAGSSGATSPGGAKLPRGVTLLAMKPAPEGVGNVAIVGVEPLRAVLVGASGVDTAGAGEQVRIMLRRSGPGSDSAAATVVRARITAPEADVSDAAESRAVVRWAPGQETAMVAVALPPIPSGAGTDASSARATAAVITVSIDRDALDADNTWRRPVEIRDSLRVGIVAPTRFGRAGSVDRLDSAAWVRLALAPRAEGAVAGGGVEVVMIEPASMDAARLAGLDAVVLPRPDLLAEGSWARIRLFIEGGGLALVLPPPGVTVHLWGDEMIRVLEPGFALAREVRSLGSGADGSRPVMVPSTAGSGAGAGLLSLIEGELTELLRPVTVSRVLPMMPGTAPAGSGTPAAGLPGQTLIALPDGTPLLWVGGVGQREEAEGATRPAIENRGMLAYMATALDLEWTDLPTKPLMVPMLNELVLQGVGRARGATWTLAGNRPAVGRRAAELVRLGAADSSRTVRIDDDGFAGEPIRRAGLWQSRDDRGTRRSVIAVNPDPAGTRTAPQPRDALQAWLGSATTGESGDVASGQRIVWLPRSGSAATAPGTPGTVRSAMAAAIGSAEQGSPVSLPLLVAVLAVALIELILARWASHASVVSAGQSRMPRISAQEAAA